jgi:hypothetical protein
LPVVEEQVRIGKRSTVGRGNVRAYTHVTERPIEEHLRLREERIKVERRHGGSPITRVPAQCVRGTDNRAHRDGRGTVIEKQARVVEEVVVSKEVREREDTVRETARRTEVTVDRPDRDFSTVESEFRQHCTKRFGPAGVSYEESALPRIATATSSAAEQAVTGPRPRPRSAWAGNSDNQAPGNVLRSRFDTPETGHVPSRLMQRSGGRALALSPGPTPGKEYREILADRSPLPRSADHRRLRLQDRIMCASF